MRIFATLVLIACLVQPSAFAACNILPRLISAEYSQSKLVVVAKLTRKQHFQPPNADDYYVYSLATVRTIRSEASSNFRVREENNSGRASFRWSIGKTYLLFLNPTQDGMWWLYGCGNSAPIRESESTLRAIGSLKDRHGGVIQGLVTDGGEYPPRTDFSGIRIQIRGDKEQYTAITDKMGEFRLHVPAGRYAVVPVQPGHTFERDFESFENPRNVTIQNGGGAQVEFVRKRGNRAVRTHNTVALRIRGPLCFIGIPRLYPEARLATKRGVARVVGQFGV